MSAAIEVSSAVRVPENAIEMRAVRASGPGGQNVNKVASKVELRVDLTKIVGLDAFAHARLLLIAKGRLDAEGRLMVTSQRTRDQLQNIQDACDKVRELIARALIRPIVRRATRPTRGSVERRIVAKKKRGDAKKNRRNVVD
ncbi:MAG: alternative ribosome rescue aminoacyl-tRNA hydrolase ArfB [Polyangiales bacterium]